MTNLLEMTKILSMDNMTLLRSPGDIQLELAKRAAQRRKEQRLTQQGLAQRSQVSLGSIKRFEQTGEISLSSLVRIAVVLGCVDDLELVFARRSYASIEEIIREQS